MPEDGSVESLLVKRQPTDRWIRVGRSESDGSELESDGSLDQNQSDRLRRLQFIMVVIFKNTIPHKL